MAIIKKFAPFQNLSNYQVFLPDTNPNSSYFRITEFKDTFTGGKNGFLIEGSQYLKESTEVKIEILDVEGNPIYFEPGEGTPEYYEGLSKLVSVHIYNDTPIGLGKITILGELKEYVDSNGVIRPIPDEWKGVYNVKWEKEFKINKNLSNEDIVRFYKRPIIQIEELVKPIFSKSVNTVTENVSVSGIPQIPIGGTNLSNWRAGTSYKLIRTTGSWDRDVDENPITVSLDNGTTFTPTIIEVLNDRELLVDTPYTLNNLVAGFLSQSAEITYQDFQNEQISETVLTGSFAKIDMYQLKTFVGDVARVKIFRKSRNQVNDFQLVQETKLESTELLRDITTTSNTEIPYGKFDDTNFNTYWEISSVDHPVSIDSSKLSQAIKIDYSGTGVQKIITKDSFNISKDVEYTLSFKTLLDGVATGDKYINAYFSGSYTSSFEGSPITSSYIQSFMYISGSDIYKTRQNVSQNIIAERDISAKLVLEVSGDDWYISNVSLRNAQETSFSPDEFTLIQDIPRKVAVETFDFRFEFYDINNNYIPVEVLATATFDGGNDFPTNAKLLTFESDRNAFRFSSGSIGNPSYQQIQFKTTTSNLTGSILFTSQAFDIEGNFISSQSYYESGAAVYGVPFTGSYPGFLNGVTNAGALVSIANFSGSLDTDTTPESNRIRVGSIVYTASLENLQEFETVYRLEDGDNAPALLVTSNANQFIYEPTTLSPKPSGQSITVRAQRKNLASLVTPLEINSSSNAPLTYVDTVNGIDTYTISATQFSSSFASSNFDEVTYSFTGSDVFGNQQSDEITISKVINFDGVSVVLSTENTSFNSDSTGTVTSAEFDKGDGTVDVRVGSSVISHSEGLSSKNTFDIVSVTPSSGLIANSESPTTNSYGISAMNVDSGTLTLLIRYKAGDNSTTVDFTKVVNYSKAKKAQPSITFSATPQAQTIDASSIGTLIGTITDVVIAGFEGNTDLTYNQSATLSPGQYKITNVTGVTVADTTPNTSTIDITGFSGDTATGTATISYRDSEGTSGTQTIKFTLSKAKRATPVIVASLNPQTQTVDSDASFTSVGTPQDITLVVNEGGTNYVYGTSGVNTFQITDVTGGTHSGTNSFITPTTPTDETGTSGTITYSYINSEGTSFTGKTIDFSVGVSVQGINGEPGLGAVSIELNPPSQEVVIDIQDNITTPDAFDVQVYDSLGTYTYDTNLTTDATFKVGTVTNGSNSSGTITPNSVPDSNGLVVSVPIQYRDRDSNESVEIIKTHTIRVVADGSTGPGIVFTGPWNTDRIYQYDISNGRRDAVLYNDVYYATLQQAGTSVGTPDTEPTYWESLGTDSFFVAAEIAIFKESYVQNTLNIGTTSNTISAANITLWGANEYPYFSLGQSATVGTQEYGANGIFIGRHDATKNTDAPNGSYVLSLVNGTTSWMKWNGSSLDVKGAITATTISATVGNIAGFTLKNGAFYTGTKSTLASNDAGVYLGTDGIALGTNSPFKVTAAGALSASGVTISGAITATSGTFTGTINATAGNFTGFVTAGSMRFGAGVQPSKNGIYIDSNDYWYDDGNFSLGNGNITWNGTTLTVTGDITVTNPGDFAPPDAEPNDPNQDNPTAYSFGPAGGPGFDLNDVTPGTTAGLYLGASNLGYHDGSVWSSYLDNSGNFYLGGTSGALTFDASSGNLSVTGEISANSGDIGGITIASSKIYTGTGTWGATNTGFYVGSDGKFSLKDKLKWDGTTLLINGQGTFTGTVQAGDVTIGPDIGGSGIDGIKIDDYNYWYNAGDIQFRVGDATSRFVYDSDLGIAVISDSTYGGFKIYGEELGSPINKTSMNYRYFEVSPAVESNTSTNWGYFSTGGMTMKCNSIAQRNYFDLYLGHDLYISGGPLIVADDITATGNITAFGSSDKRLKDNIVPISNALEKIIKIGGYEFDWNENQKTYEGHDVGVIAQEVQEVLPEVVQEKEDGYLGVRYEKIVPLLIEGIKELVDKVESLEQEILKLKEKK